MSILRHPRPIVGADRCGRISRPLEVRLSEAIAWGRADHESTGMSSSELIRLLSEALSEIRRLKSEISRS